MSSLRQFGIPRYRAVVCYLVIFNVIFSLSLGYAQPYEKEGIYRVNTNGWIQSEIPGAGDVFTCGKCKYHVYIRISTAAAFYVAAGLFGMTLAIVLVLPATKGSTPTPRFAAR